LSASKIVEKDLVVVFTNEGGLIYHKDDCKIKGNVRATASHINGVFEIDECKKEKLSNGKSQIAEL
jgi:cytoskeletal protein CcmA (bactofilin family)